VSERRNIDLFRDDIDARLNYHRAENKLSYAETIGVLEIILHELKMELWSNEHSEDDEE
jgi:hypothetical protein